MGRGGGELCFLTLLLLRWVGHVAAIEIEKMCSNFQWKYVTKKDERDTKDGIKMATLQNVWYWNEVNHILKDRQCTCNIILWLFRVTSFAMETQQCLSFYVVIDLHVAVINMTRFIVATGTQQRLPLALSSS
jgi:hypothetical protein